MSQFAGDWYIGRVVDVKDPDQSGRVRVRVYGKHDDEQNIPNDKLDWCLVMQPITSAAYGKVGTTPLGLVVNSKVIVKYMDKHEQHAIVLGSFGKAGDPIPGQTSNGTEQIDIKTGSIPGGAINQSDPLPYTPYNAMGDFGFTINTLNDPERNDPNDSTKQKVEKLKPSDGVDNKTAVDKKLKQPNKPTTASADKGDKSDVLDIVKNVDPKGLSTVLQNAVSEFSTVRNIMNLTSPAGIQKMLSGGILGAISGLAGRFGFSNVIGPMMGLYNSGLLPTQAQSALRLALAVSTFTAQTNGGVFSHQTVSSVIPQIDPNIGYPPSIQVVTSVPPTYVQQYYPLGSEPYPGFIQWIDSTGNSTTPLYTLRGNEPHYPSASARIQGDTTLALQVGMAASIATHLANVAGFSTNISPAIVGQLASSLTGGLGGVSAAGIASVLGHGVNLNSIISLATKLIPNIAGSIQGLMSSHLPQSTLDQGSVGNTMSEFSQSQAKLAIKKKSMKKALDPKPPEDQDAQIQAYKAYQEEQANSNATNNYQTQQEAATQSAAEQGLSQNEVNPATGNFIGITGESSTPSFMTGS